jgi:acylphosphatase
MGKAMMTLFQFDKRDNMSMKRSEARRWLVRGRVQGVGFRYFAQRKAVELGLDGWARNLDDGTVEVYAAGPPERLSDLAAALHIGPRMADVRGVEEMEDVAQRTAGFSVR